MADRTGIAETFKLKRTPHEEPQDRMSRALGIEVQGKYDLLEAQVVELFSKTTRDRKIQLGSVFKMVPASIYEDPESRFQKARRIISKLKSKLLRPNGFDIVYTQDDGIEKSGYFLQRPERNDTTNNNEHLAEPAKPSDQAVSVQVLDINKFKKIPNMKSQKSGLDRRERSKHKPAATGEPMAETIYKRSTEGGTRPERIKRAIEIFDYIHSADASVQSLQDVSNRYNISVKKVIGTLKFAILCKEIEAIKAGGDHLQTKRVKT